MRETLHTEIALGGAHHGNRAATPGAGTDPPLDRGIQYAAEPYRLALARSGITPAPRPAQTSSNISRASTIPAACIRSWATSAQLLLTVWRPNPVHFFGGRSVFSGRNHCATS